jgi:hypothetical protein
MRRGSLFTHEFLRRGIVETPELRDLPADDVEALAHDVRERIERFARQRTPTEQRTEDELIWPVLERLGWEHHTRQVSLSARGRESVPDGLLFADVEAKERADALGNTPHAYEHGLAIVESKRWERQLDRRGGDITSEYEVPSSQMLRYLRRVEDLTEGGVRWGILTNGRIWRLYFQGARSVSEDFFEVDLARLVGAEGYEPTLFDGDPDHFLRVFVLMFRRAAFLSSRPDGRTFHQVSLDEGRRWEALITERLSERVFDQVFPRLVTAIGANDPERPRQPDEGYLEEVKHGALVFLYRLLFLLYAEDRDLLPFRDDRYDDYGLNKEVRQKIARRRDHDDTFAAEFGPLHNHLKTLFRIVDTGAASIGIPPYDGGLFDPEETPIIERIEIPDETLAPLVDWMSRDHGGDTPQWINYRDLSVQHLGSIYERLLENRVVAQDDGRLAIESDERARKGTGSYYTSEHAVQLIIGQAIGPLLKEKTDAFQAEVERLRSDPRSVEERLDDLQQADPAEAFLNIKVCDPAMGSGHFLVSLVDYLATRTLAAMAEAEAAVDWAPADRPYQSPVGARITGIRDHVLDAAHRHGWSGVTPDQLDDRQIVRRMILKRVVHGVDKNPMAVELAKVSLWLHTFTVGAPLSFLEHHLRVGDSISGESVRAIEDRLDEHGHRMLIQRSVEQASRATEAMTRVEKLSDADISEVEESRGLYEAIAERTGPLRRFLDFMHALHWVVDAVGDKKTREARTTAVQALLDGQFGDPVRVVAGLDDPAAPEATDPDDGGLPGLAPAPAAQQTQLLATARDRATWETLRIVLDETRKLAAREQFMHWEPAFPGVWSNWEARTPEGGFDAVIGNPPYVRGEKLGDLKRFLKQAYKAHQGQADLYVYFYELGLRLLRPGGRLSYIVTNKWLRAGYAEPLRRLFGEEAWIETVLDFGHAKQFFPDADVFPCVIAARRPTANDTPPEETKVAVIPRDEVRIEDLGNQVASASFGAPRVSFGADAWRLEPPEVNALMDKIGAAGSPLKDIVGDSPNYGIKTGLNEAFLIDTDTKNSIVNRDPGSSEIIQPYLRGQNIDRWLPDWDHLWMIFTRHGIEIDQYPGIKEHLNKFRRSLEPKPRNWQPTRRGEEWPGRKHGSYRWYEIQDAVDYYEKFYEQKILYQVIQYHPRFALDRHGYLGNDKTFFIPSKDKVLLATLNSPMIWWYNWRYLPHLKDEALSPMGYLVEQLPIATPTEADRTSIEQRVDQILQLVDEQADGKDTVHQWLRAEFEVTKIGHGLQEPWNLSDDEFVAAVKRVKPGGSRLSSTAVKALHAEHNDTIEPMRRRAAEIRRMERELSELVNKAYGLTEEEVALMWRTAPPRMPVNPAS